MRNRGWLIGMALLAASPAVAEPVADTLLAAVPKAGSAPTLAGMKAAMPGVRWAPAAQRGTLASGRLPPFAVAVLGAGAPQTVQLSWHATGQPLPLDLQAALAARGARLTMVSCEKLGVGEGTRSYVGQVPGRAPFGLVVDQREAPTADAQSRYVATLIVAGPMPPRESIDCEPF